MEISISIRIIVPQPSFIIASRSFGIRSHVLYVASVVHRLEEKLESGERQAACGVRKNDMRHGTWDMRENKSEFILRF